MSNTDVTNNRKLSQDVLNGKTVPVFNKTAAVLLI